MSFAAPGTPLTFLRSWGWPLVLAAALAAIYLPGLGNVLIFDDQRLLDGTIFGVYGSLSALKSRLISYGSFVWLDTLVGQGWAAQRVANLLLHALTMAALYALLRELTRHVRWRLASVGGGQNPGAKTGAMVFGVLLFGLNPVATYAVAYLIQRSILMATLFSVASLYCVARAAGQGRRTIAWSLAALGMYVLALLSKEYAVMLPVAALAVFFSVRRPSRRVALTVISLALAVGATAAAFLAAHYGDIVGHAFDNVSREYVVQLSRISPAVAGNEYALSVFNQTWLFFRYGVTWLIPNVQWMSLDLHPSFPLSFTSLPHLAGPLLYLLLLVGSTVMMWRFNDWRRLLGLGLFIPAALFATEFATVWIQDPFVLYRSYLWAMGIPLIATAVLGNAGSDKVLAAACGIAVLVLVPLSVERVQSMRSEYTAWQDAAAKTDLSAPANAVGRWRPYMNLGNQYLARGMLNEATLNYTIASRLQDPTGLTYYHLGVALRKQGRPREALLLQSSAIAARAMPADFAALPFIERGEIEFLAGEHAAAIGDFGAALTRLNGDTEAMLRALKVRAQCHLRLGQTASGVADYERALTLAPGDRATQIGFALALHADKQVERSAQVMAKLLQEHDDWDVHFARAMMYRSEGRLQEARQEATMALRLKPDDPGIQQLARSLGS